MFKVGFQSLSKAKIVYNLPYWFLFFMFQSNVFICLCVQAHILKGENGKGNLTN